MADSADSQGAVAGPGSGESAASSSAEASQTHKATYIAALFPDSKACRLQFVCGDHPLPDDDVIFVGQLKKEKKWETLEELNLPLACLEVDIDNSVIYVKKTGTAYKNVAEAKKWKNKVKTKIIEDIGFTSSKFSDVGIPALSIKKFIDDKFQYTSLSCLLRQDKRSLLLLSSQPDLVACAKDEIDKKVRVLWTSKTSRGHQVLICQGDMAESNCQLTVLPMCDGGTEWEDDTFKRILEKNFLHPEMTTYKQQIATDNSKPPDMTLLCNAGAADQRDGIDVSRRIVLVSVPDVRDTTFDDKYLEAVESVIANPQHSNATSFAIPLLPAGRDGWTQEMLTSLQELLERRREPCTVLLYVLAVAKEAMQRWMDQQRDFQTDGWSATLHDTTLSGDLTSDNDKLLVCLFNAQSVKSKKQGSKRKQIHDAIVSKGVDIMFMTETWLKSEDDNSTKAIRALTPVGYKTKSYPRLIGGVGGGGGGGGGVGGGGGGICVIYRDTLDIECFKHILCNSCSQKPFCPICHQIPLCPDCNQTTHCTSCSGAQPCPFCFQNPRCSSCSERDAPPFQTLEFVEATVHKSGQSFTFACIYRPPNKPERELQTLFDLYSSKPNKVIILGDFNIHFDSDLFRRGRKEVFRKMRQNNFKQFVTDVTRPSSGRRGLLDWVVAKELPRLISEKDVAVFTDLYSDHYAVLCSVNI